MRTISKLFNGCILLVMTTIPFHVVRIANANAEMVLEEVVVTARKREESLQDVPISVSTFTGEELRARGLSNISQLADFTPGLEMDFTAPISGSSGSVSTFIRGIGQTDFLLTIDPGVGTYVDGVYVSRSIGGLLDLLDVERIEVLKGPQGTLFGRNTIGGAINIVSSQPSEEFSFSAEGSVGNFNRQDLRMTSDIPLLSGKLLSRVAFSSKSQDGFGDRVAPFLAGNRINNPVGNPLAPTSALERKDKTKLGEVNTDAARLTLFYPGESLQAQFSFDYTRARETAPAATLAGFTTDVTATDRNNDGAVNGLDVFSLDLSPINIDGDPADPLGLIYNTFNEALGLGLLPYDGRFKTNDPFTNFGTAPAHSNYDVLGLNFTLDFEFFGLGIKSITAYRDLDASFGREGDLSPITLDHTSNDYSDQQFSQELQISGKALDDRLNWLVGFYYLREDGRDEVQVPLLVDLFLALDGNPNVAALTTPLILAPGVAVPLSIFANPGAVGLDLFLDEINDVTNTSAAAFAQGTYSLTEALDITVGVRYTRDNKEYRPTHITQFTQTPLLIDNTDKSFVDTTPSVSINYRWNESIMTFFSFSQGFKSGGFTGRTVDPQPNGARPFQPETVDAFEIGFKSDLFNNRLRLNASWYYTDYSDLQLINQEGVTPITVNAGSATIKGVDLEFQAILTRRISLNGGYSYIDAGYDEITDPFATTKVTDKFVNTPENTVNLSLIYDLPVAALGGDLIYRADYSYKDDHYNDAENTPELFQKAFHLLNMSLNYKSATKRWEFVSGVTNLTDKEYIVSGFNQPGVGFIEANYARPRTWYLTAKFNY